MTVLCLCRKQEVTDEAAAFDEQSSAVIRMNNSTVLYLKQVNRFLALVCILREESHERQGQNEKRVTIVLLMLKRMYFGFNRKNIFLQV